MPGPHFFARLTSPAAPSPSAADPKPEPNPDIAPYVCLCTLLGKWSFERNLVEKNRLKKSFTFS